MAKDLIIGVVDNYDWDKIKYWANSIKKSGFTGHKAVIAYNMDAATVNKLTAEDFMIVGCTAFDQYRGFVYNIGDNNSIMVDRFMHIYQMLEQLEQQNGIERVIATDVRDVVFQSNPSEWLDNYLLSSQDMIIGSENMNYEDEPWGSNNMTQAFGEFFSARFVKREINCAGVVGGRLDAFKDFCLNIYLMCRGLNPKTPGGGGPDQAALNILLACEAYAKRTAFTNPANGWVVHAGTSLPAIQAGSGGIGQAYKANPSMQLRFVNRIDYSVHNDEIYANDKKVTIVHQWDRVPEWKTLVERKFGV